MRQLRMVTRVEVAIVVRIAVMVVVVSSLLISERESSSLVGGPRRNPGCRSAGAADNPNGTWRKIAHADTVRRDNSSCSSIQILVDAFFAFHKVAVRRRLQRMQPQAILGADLGVL